MAKNLSFRDDVNICFVRPLSRYKVKQTSSVLSLTFPQLVRDLGLKIGQFTIYDRNLSSESFSDYLKHTNTTHVFITSITSTFPDALHCARVAKEFGCITIIGGIFASMNATIIQEFFTEFDYCVSGKPNSDLLSMIQNRENKPAKLLFPNIYDMEMEIGHVICNPAFTDIDQYETVSYEITTGCKYSCSFCSMRSAWKDSPVFIRPVDVASSDIALLSSKWRKLKIIDDDFLQSYDMIRELEFGDLFDQIIVETRVNRINQKAVRFMKRFGVTHVILGVEAFEKNFVRETKKGSISSWEYLSNRAIDLCAKNGLIARPVLMLTGPHLDFRYVISLKKKIKGWKPTNNVETLFSFFTPHPGLAKRYPGLFITNDLSRFDHLNLVYLPSPLKSDDEYRILNLYHELVDITESKEFNPNIDISRDHHVEFEYFFPK